MSANSLPPFRSACSIIMPLHNQLELTKECLETLISNTPAEAYEVILVDNASTDGTGEFLDCLEGDVSIVRSTSKLGFAEACNQGAAVATGKSLVFLKSDVLLHRGWLDAVLEWIEADPGIGAIGCKLLGRDGAIQHAGVALRMEGDRPIPYLVHHGAEAQDPEVCRRREFSMVAGACLATPSALFHQLGGFDARYHTSNAWLDYGLRVRQAGFAVMYCPESGMTQLRPPLEASEHVLEERDRLDFENRWQEVLEAEATCTPPVMGVAQVASAPHILFTMFGWTEEGGGTLLPRQIAKRLVKRGYRVSVLFTPIRTLPDQPPYHLERSQDEGVELYALYNRPAVFYDTGNPGREVDDPEARRIMADLLNELRPDLVHYHSFATFSMGIAAEVARARVPSLYTSHNYWPICPRMYLITPDFVRCEGPSPDGRKCAACLGEPDQVDGYARRLLQGQETLNARIDRHLAVSNRVRDLFVANGHDPVRIQVLHQALDTVDALWATVGAVRPRGTDPSAPLRIGFFGSVVEHKGVHVLVNAVQHLDPTQVEVHVFGAGPTLYGQVLEHLDHKRMVQFHGHYDSRHLPELLKQVDLVVIPSIWDECGPLVAAEALAACCPVIGSRLGGLPDFIEHGVNGMLFEPGDAVGLANILAEFIARPELLETMQRTIPPARGFNAYLNALEAHYRELITPLTRA